MRRPAAAAGAAEAERAGQDVVNGMQCSAQRLSDERCYWVGALSRKSAGVSLYRKPLLLFLPGVYASLVPSRVFQGRPATLWWNFYWTMAVIEFTLIIWREEHCGPAVSRRWALSGRTSITSNVVFVPVPRVLLILSDDCYYYSNDNEIMRCISSLLKLTVITCWEFYAIYASTSDLRREDIIKWWAVSVCLSVCLSLALI